MTTYVIGFADFYYTLWSYICQSEYVVDNHGSKWFVGYNYIYQYHKNISKSWDKAKELYPDLEIDENLRGITSSKWTKRNEDDSCPNIMKFGKYRFHNIDELIESDFNYIVWICKNQYQNPNGKYALAQPKVIQHFQEINRLENEESNKKKNAFDNLLSKGIFEFTCERSLSLCENGAGFNLNVDDINVNFYFRPGTFKEMDYKGYSFALPIIDGKAKRIKSKKLRLTFDKSDSGSFDVNVNKIELI